MDWLEYIRSFTSDLARVAEDSDPTLAVPTCPEWNLADLTWHLLEVQDFWTWVITNRPSGPDEYAQPTRPPDAQLPAGLRNACDGLISALTSADPDDAAWSWTDDHTVGFTYRRQAHEAFVHLADARAAAGEELPAAPTEFGVDGIDEVTTNNFATIPEWGQVTPSHDRLVALHATDADRIWTFQFGSFSGTSPNTGTVYADEPQVLPVEGDAESIARADATTLDLWLWGRAPTAALEVSGDPQLIEDLRTVAAGETQ